MNIKKDFQFLHYSGQLSSYFPSPTPSLKRFSMVFWPQPILRNILAKVMKNLILRREPQIHFQGPEKAIIY